MECEVKDFLGTLYFQISDQPEKRTKIASDKNSQRYVTHGWQVHKEYIQLNKIKKMIHNSRGLKAR